MDEHEDVTQLPEEFDGRVRLFPLPGLVLFPHAMQPLHVFEPRYCEMLAEALAGDQMIAMATLDTSAMDESVALADERPPLQSTVCLGKIVSHTELEDDRHNILLVGIRRARIRCEVETSRSFRMAEVEVMDDIYPPTGSKDRRALKGRLLDSFGRIIPPTESVQKNLYELMAGQLSLGPITDIISYMMPLEATQKIELLALPNVDRRAERLIEFLDSGDIQLDGITVEKKSLTKTKASESAPTKDFPPPFSVN